MYEAKSDCTTGYMCDGSIWGAVRQLRKKRARKLFKIFPAEGDCDDFEELMEERENYMKR